MPIYIDEWEASRFVQRLSYEGRGIFASLLMHQWRDGSLPADVREVYDLLGLAPVEYEGLPELLNAKFPARNGHRRNAKLAELRRAAVAKCRKARESATMRWHMRPQSDGNANRSKGKENTTSPEVPPEELRPRGNWVTEFGTAWKARFQGVVPWQRIGHALKPLRGEYQDSEILSRWERYLSRVEGRFASPEDFAKKFGEWCPQQKGLRDSYLRPGDVV